MQLLLQLLYFFTSYAYPFQLLLLPPLLSETLFSSPSYFFPALAHTFSYHEGDCLPLLFAGLSIMTMQCQNNKNNTCFTFQFNEQPADACCLSRQLLMHLSYWNVSMQHCNSTVRLASVNCALTSAIDVLSSSFAIATVLHTTSSFECSMLLLL